MWLVRPTLSRCKKYQTSTTPNQCKKYPTSTASNQGSREIFPTLVRIDDETQPPPRTSSLVTVCPIGNVTLAVATGIAVAARSVHESESERRGVRIRRAGSQEQCTKKTERVVFHVPGPRTRTFDWLDTREDDWGNNACMQQGRNNGGTEK